MASSCSRRIMRWTPARILDTGDIGQQRSQRGHTRGVDRRARSCTPRSDRPAAARRSRAVDPALRPAPPGGPSTAAGSPRARPPAGSSAACRTGWGSQRARRRWRTRRSRCTGLRRDPGRSARCLSAPSPVPLGRTPRRRRDGATAARKASSAARTRKMGLRLMTHSSRKCDATRRRSRPPVSTTVANSP